MYYFILFMEIFYIEYSPQFAKLYNSNLDTTFLQVISYYLYIYLVNLMLITTIYSIISILIIFSGIALFRYFAKRKVQNNSYKPALFICIIWFIIPYLGLSYLYLVISSLIFSFSNPLRYAFLNIHSVSTIIIELFIVSILVQYFYKIKFEDSIFITVQVISVQILIRIIVTNILEIIFNLTTGGFINFYIFQY